MSNSNENKRNELHDDWRLSAWLLNELSDSDRLEFEQIIRERPACKAELQSMQQVIDQLTNALQNEPFPEDVPDGNANGGNAN
ncbi:MAG: hypothetical protein Q4G68_14755, partial [Planctomycetia bacterium]|nr:hypothetical protein [Planctomycetia bacterium]